MKFSTLFLIAATLLISGCAQNTYIPPASGPRAQLTIPAKTNAAVAVFQDSKLCLNKNFLKGNNYSTYSKEAITQTIPANQLVSLYLSSSGDNRSCLAVVSFKPKANQAYTLTATWKQKGLMSSLLNNDIGNCTFTIMNVETREAIPVMARQYQRPIFSKQVCRDALAEGQSDMPEVTTVTVPINYRN